MSTRTTLDPWEDRYARRVFGMRSSVMRDLMAITQRPEVISLAGGLPDTGAFDRDVLARLVSRIATEDGAKALQYGPTEGIREMQLVIADVMRHEGMDPDPGSILVTTGGQQVLDLFARTFVDPGDVVIAEGPTYPGVVPCFSAVQADIRHVPLDAGGLDPDRVEALIAQLSREGLRAKYLYTIPTFQNPGGCTTTLERRRRLIELANRHDLLILEDNPYSLLRYEGEPVPTLRSLDTEDRVAYLGTFSKIFSPGVRVGWLEAPKPILARINLMKQAADLCSSTFMQLLVTRFFEDGSWIAWVDQLCDIYRERRDAMVVAVREHFPDGTAFTVPEGGLFLWATLPAGIDTTDLLARAIELDVAFVPGAGAFLDGGGTTSMRLNFSAMPPDRIVEGIRRIGSAAKDALELARTLGLTGSMPAIASAGVGVGVEVGGGESATQPAAARAARAPAPAPQGDGAAIGPPRALAARAARAARARLDVVVVCGGSSAERAVSLRSGETVAEALRELGHHATVLDVGSDASRLLKEGDFDCAFVALHGRGGDDGGIQSVLELVGIPYTGTRPAACEAAFDKARAKRRLDEAGVPTPEFVTLTETALEEFGAADALDEAQAEIGFPLVVKPARGGSSLGVRLVDDAHELPRAITAAMSYDRRVLVERHVAGRELAVVVVGDAYARALPPVGIRPRHSGWFDYESRYAPGETEFSCPAEGFTAEELAGASATALQAWAALDGSGLGRVDLIVDGAGTPWVLEVSTVPGLTDTSIVPIACEGAGITLPDLVDELLDDALARSGRPRTASV